MAELEKRLATLSNEKRRQLLDRIQARAAGAAPQVAIPRRPNPAVAPLSFSQHRLWLLDQLEPGTSAYNCPDAVRMTGRLDENALAETLREIVRRHESLRTSFQKVDGEVMQVIAPEGTLALPVIDLRHLPPQERESRARELAAEHAGAPFDLSVGPLFRATLLKLAAEEHVLLLATHHIVSDGWSMGVFSREVAALYEAFAAGRPVHLPELPIQYGDYAHWQREQSEGEVPEGQLAYWKEQLAGVSVLQLPTDRPRPAKLSYRGATQHLLVPPERADALRAMSRSEGSTLFMTLLAAFQTLLCRYTGQEDVAVGTPVANRSPVETEALIGFFVNMVVMRTDLSGNPTFRELLGRVRDLTLGAFSNQDFPFEKLVDELRIERSMSYSPLFQVILTLQNTPAEETVLPDLVLSGLPSPTGAAKLDIDLSISEKKTGLHCELTYSTDLFDWATMQRMLDHFDTLLKAIVADPGQRISDLPLMTPTEQQRLLVAWNETASEYPQHLSVHQLVERQVADTPDAIAAVYAGANLSYRALNSRANQLAHYLRASGVRPGVLVGLCVERSLEMLVGLLAVLKAGGAYVPIDPAYPPERIGYMLADASVPLLLTQERLIGQLPACDAQVIPIDGEAHAWEDASEANPVSEVSTGDLAYVIFTSGTTGKPKGVMVEHQNVVAYVHAFTREFGPLSDQVVLQLASFSFDTFVEEVCTTLAGGGKLVIPVGMEFLNLANFARLVNDHGVTLVSAPPLLLAEIDGVEPLETVRTWISGGDVLKAEHVANLVKTAKVYNTYGPTETTVCATYHRYTGEAESWRIPLGRPISNYRVYILDRFGKPVPPGVAGELHIAGAGVARGYLNGAELTAERFLPDPRAPGGRMYRTGDLARYLSNGEIEYLGRIDHQVKIRGFRVELGEIEAVLAQYPGVREAVLLAREDRPGNKQLVAYMVSAGEHEVDAAQLRRFLRRQLPEYMVPALFVTLPELPVTANGKVDRSMLPAPRVTREERPAAPGTPMEAVLAGIWAEVLGLEQVGVNDHFFDLGGHSLLAIKVLSRLRAALGVELPVRSLFEAPTVAELAQTLEAALPEQSGMSTEPIGRVARDGHLPLSFAQQRLWFLDQLVPGMAAYNIPIAVRLTGPLDKAAMEQALGEIARRHESLRTTFAKVDGEPVQVIAPEATISLPVADLSDLPAGEREARARTLAAEEAGRPFCLETGPMLRLNLLQLGAEEHVLLLTVHHIAADGWSMGVFVRELTTLYEAYLSGRPSPLPDLPVQYADFAHWQRNWLNGEILERQLAYWTEQLAGVSVLQLPTDYPRPAVQTYRGATQNLSLPKELADGLKALSRREGTTLFMTLLATFQTLLYRYTGQDDVSVGTPVANRNRVEIESLIGSFVNTLVMRTDLSGNPTFRELLGRVREVTLGAYTHQDAPFEKLVETVQPERTLTHHPLFQVMITLQNAPTADAELPGLTRTAFPADTHTAKFDLDLSVAEHEQGLQAEITYSTDLFEQGTITRMIGHWRRLLEAIVADPDRPVANLPLMTAAEQQEMLDWNATAVGDPGGHALHQLVEAQAAGRPDAVAVIAGDQLLTYRELNERANRLAHYLRKLGVRPDELVGICAERSLPMVVGLLGILKAGGTYLPLDPNYPAERLGYMLTDAGVRVLLTQAHLTAGLPAHTARTFRLDADWDLVAGESGQNPPCTVTPEHLAYMIYTSGSTGQPKGVLISHRAICNHTQWMQAAYPLTPADRVLQKTPFSFDASVWEFWSPLAAGAPLVMAAPGGHQDSAYLVEAIRQHGITVLQLVPTMLGLLLEEPGLSACTSLRRLFCGGEVLTGELRDRFQATLAAELHNLYGPTEATIDATAWTCGRGEVHPVVPIGRPVANVQTYVLDAERQPVPVGVAGELYIGGAGLAQGYWNRPELTAERFLPNPFGPGRLYRTGDLVRYLPDGNLLFLGRVDHQVKIRGFRIELGEIETVLSRHPGVREAAVLAREEQPGNRQLVAYVVPIGEAAPQRGELRRFLRSQLPEYMVPAAFVQLPSLPLTASGKVDRRALPAPEGSREWLESPYVAPRTTTEEALVQIWAAVLGREQVGVHDNLFDLGGHSLLITQLSSRIAAHFRVEVSLRQLFEQPTVAEIAEVIAQQQSLAGVETTPPDEGARLQEQSGQRQIRHISFGQERLWFLDQFQPESPFYNIPDGVRLQGALNTRALEQTLGEIIRRHEVLRTSFQVEERRPVQVVDPPQEFTLPVIDLRTLAHDHREEEALRLAAAESSRPFDLSRGPLLRLTLLKLREDDHILVLVMHHIITDGWSMGVLGREVSALYAAFAAGRPSPLPALPVQYADFAHWQRNRLQGQVLEQQLAYWTQQLAGVSVLQLPADYARPALQSYRGATQSLSLPKELAEGLKALSRREGTTLFMTLLAAFQTLLYRYTGQEDVSVGTPVANRNRLETEALIGFFVNTLVMRTDLSGNPTFRELLGRVREVALGAYSNQEVPFEKLVEVVQPERALSHHALFQVMFTLQTAQGAPAELAGVTLTPLTVENTTSKFDLDLSVAEHEQGLQAEITYCTDLFEQGTIARMIGHWRTLLEAIVADPNRRVANLPLMTAAEQQQLLDWNATAVGDPGGHALHQLVEAQAAQRPDAVAVVAGDQLLTYRQLNERANRLAHYLRKLGVRPDELVGICAERSLPMVVGLLAILKAGGAYLPLDPDYPAERLGYMLSDAGVRVLLTQEHLKAGLPAHTARSFRLDADWDLVEGESGENPPCTVTPEHLAYMIYTSGSTGQPKGVLISHRAICNHTQWMQAAYPLTPADRVLQKTPFSFDASVWEFWSPLAAGAQLVMAAPGGHQDSAYLVEAIRQHRITVLQLVPTMLDLLLEEPGLSACTSLRRLFCGGEVLTGELRDRFQATLAAELHNLYGPTEATIDATAWTCGRGEVHPVVPIGRPVANAQTYVLDAERQPVPVGVAGELYIGGAGLAQGYLNRPELTAERFLPNPFGPGRLYRTGDLARYLPDGNLLFVGRVDHQVKIRGFRIELGEIETVLSRHPGVRGAAVLAREEQPGNRQLVAYVVPVGEAAPQSGELRQFLRTQLPEYMVPAAFLLLPALPLTASGKVDRRALPAPEGSRDSLETPYVAPRTQTEAVMAAIWAEALGLPEVGVHDHFFELGGHSLLATQVVARTRAALGVELALRSLFEAPTVAELSLKVESIAQTTGG